MSAEYKGYIVKGSPVKQNEEYLGLVPVKGNRVTLNEKFISSIEEVEDKAYSQDLKRFDLIKFKVFTMSNGNVFRLFVSNLEYRSF